MKPTILILAAAILPSSAMATSWEQCRALGLSSAVDCKRYDEDPVFRAQVNQTNGVQSYHPVPAAPQPMQDPQYQPTRKCTDDRDFNCIKKW